VGIVATRLKADVSGLKEFEQQLKQLDTGAMQRFTEQMVEELAEIAFSKIISKTPVGIYPASSGKQGGTLRENWSVGEVIKKGDLYEVEITNSMDYASYVEFGHRTVNHAGWVPGQFMMTISEKELEMQGPAIIERRLKTFLEGALNG
jgi:hypothetical protein